MAQLRIALQDWQQTALDAMARARGTCVEAVAECLLAEWLEQGVRRACDDLLRDVPRLPWDDVQHDTIEQRLSLLFDA